MAGMESNDVWKLQKQQTLGLKEISKNNNLNVYPNPSKEFITVENIVKDTEYSIIDLSGKIIQFGKTNGQIDVQFIKKGMYVLKISDKETKIIVE